MPSWVGKIVAPGQNEWPWIGAAGEFDRLFAVLAENLEQRAGMFLLKLLFEIDAAVKLAHLADFFLKGHPAEQVFNPPLHRERRILIRELLHTAIPP